VKCLFFNWTVRLPFQDRHFFVKPRLKTSDYLTRNNLDSNTPPFYSLKQRKKAGFRTQSQITDKINA
jgi:hypothetical protein